MEKFCFNNCWGSNCHVICIKDYAPLSGVFCPQFDRNLGQEKDHFPEGEETTMVGVPVKNFGVFSENRSTPIAIKENAIFSYCNNLVFNSNRTDHKPKGMSCGALVHINGH